MKKTLIIAAVCLAAVIIPSLCIKSSQEPKLKVVGYDVVFNDGTSRYYDGTVYTIDGAYVMIYSSYPPSDNLKIVLGDVRSVTPVREKR